MSIRSACLVVNLSLFCMAVANASVISTYTDQSAWQTALAGSIFSEESFNGAATNFNAASSGNAAGSVSVDLIGGVGDPGPAGLTGTGFLQGEVDSSAVGSGDGVSLTINHGAAIGFGLLGLQNDSASNAAGLNLAEIGLLVDGSAFLVSDLLGLTDSATATGGLDNTPSDAAIPFIGFILDNPLGSFSIVHGDQVYAPGVAGGSEEFYLDGMIFASAASTHQLPAPAPAILLLAGVAGLRFARRNRGAKALI